MRLLWEYIVQAISDFVFKRLFVIRRASQYEIYAHLIDKHYQHVVGMLKPLDISASSPRNPLSLLFWHFRKNSKAKRSNLCFPFRMDLIPDNIYTHL